VWLKAGKQHNDTKLEGYSSGREKAQDSGSTGFMYLSQKTALIPESSKVLGTWKVKVIPATIVSGGDSAAMRLESSITIDSMASGGWRMFQVQEHC
jgi:hypothetical protein